MITATRHPFKISWVFTKEESSAIHLLELVPSGDGSDAYDVLISYQTTPDKVYRYEVDNDSTAERWYDLLNDPNARSITSWGYEVNRARAHGDIVEV
jgi:hypothetical protein